MLCHTFLRSLMLSFLPESMWLKCFATWLKHLTVFEMFCDLTKAFDCVDHSLLLSKLFSFDMHGPSLQWFQFYLSSRCQQVKVPSLNPLFDKTQPSTSLSPSPSSSTVTPIFSSSCFPVIFCCLFPSSNRGSTSGICPRSSSFSSLHQWPPQLIPQLF